ncbi:MAG: hypothetical protein HY645_05420 [Acidobacteria bacterium]|nr:hypothetical protein [Acidobacteriota bacterium]
MHFRSLLFVLAWVVLSPALVLSQPVDFFPLELVKPGLKGYGKTVFQESTPEVFDVEILGVIQNVGPGQNMILARLSGTRIERTGIFAGMSGSPVYLDDKLAGAVAYAFRFAKEPIAGITPINEIVNIFRERPQSRNRVSTRARRVEEILQPFEPDLPDARRQYTVPADEFASLRSLGSLTAIASPVSFSGFTPQSLLSFAPYFERLGLMPVRSQGAGIAQNRDKAPLQPGSTISVQMVRGDMDVSASGTVTHIMGDRVYAFGHPFLGIGYTDMPLNMASVLTVIPSLMTSEKISATTEFIGSVRQDRATGIMGITGAKPQLVPVHLTLRTSRNEVKEFNYEVVTDPFLTPFLMTLTIHNSIVSSERSIGEQTLRIKCKIDVKNQPAVHFENNVTALASTAVVAANAASAPVNFLLNSGFENVVMEQIELEISAQEQTREAELEKVWQEKTELRAGEELMLTLFLRKANGENHVQKHTIKVPEELGEGPINVLIGDGVSLSRKDRETSASYFPETLPQLIKSINNLKKNDRLYVQLYREKAGPVLQGEGMTDLPPSLLALYGSSKTEGDVRFVKKVVYLEHELPSTDFVLSGEKVITVNIKK